MSEITCPKCGSAQWRCWDEQTEWFEDEDGEPFEYPVGYLACLDCGHGYTHTDCTAKYLGRDTKEAFGWDE